MSQISRTKEEPSTGPDFVAIGNLVAYGESYHAALVVKYGGKLTEFHYNKSGIDLRPLKNDYYYVATPTIPQDDVPAFLAMCQNIKKKANPEYGYFYSGESYDAEGNHLGQIDLGERMTCVGFCLNVLKGFLEEEYLQYSDWESTTHDSPGYLEQYCIRHGLNPEMIKSAHRRINPRECLISCFFENLPIRKSDIDSRRDEVDQFFSNRK